MSSGVCKEKDTEISSQLSLVASGIPVICNPTHNMLSSSTKKPALAFFDSNRPWDRHSKAWKMLGGKSWGNKPGTEENDENVGSCAFLGDDFFPGIFRARECYQ